MYLDEYKLSLIHISNFEHQITFDVRQPKTHKYSMERLRKFIAEHPYVNVIRYTTFFHQFTLIFDELKREKFVDWYGSVSYTHLDVIFFARPSASAARAFSKLA